jgi:hypothetical protein
MLTRISKFLLVSFAIFAASLVTANAQTTLTGEWRASLTRDDSKINLNFERKNEKGGRNSMGQTYEFSELGLTREQVVNGGPVRFSLMREAGTIECEGNFENRKGSGSFRFTGNQAFLAAMKSRGFDFEQSSKNYDEDHPAENRLFAATALNVTTALADDLLSAGFKMDVGDLFKAAIFKVDSKFMREMKATGYANLDFDDLVKAKIFHIDAEFVREAAQMGFDKQPFENLVKMSIFKITPQFVAGLRNEGLTDLTMEQMVKLKIFNIDAEAIRKARAEGVPLTVDKLVEWKLGVKRMSSGRII